MLNTPEEKLKYLRDRLIWAWYATCLPMDRRKRKRLPVPETIDTLLTSPRIAELIRTQFREGMRQIIDGMLWQAKRYVEIKMYTREERAWCAEEGRQLLCKEVRECKQDFFEFQLRSLLLPSTMAEMQKQLRVQAPWMYAELTSSERELLAEIAEWHLQQQ